MKGAELLFIHSFILFVSAISDDDDDDVMAIFVVQ